MPKSLFPKAPPGMLYAKARPPTQESSVAYRQGLQAFLNGDNERAKTIFGQAHQMDPMNQEAAMAVSRINPGPPAPHIPASDALYKQGLEKFLSGDMEKATILWSQAAQVNPNKYEAIRGLQRLAQKKGMVLIPQTK
jgi:tetratricopeptide (TPR) repeat protein